MSNTVYIVMLIDVDLTTIVGVWDSLDAAQQHVGRIAAVVPEGAESSDDVIISSFPLNAGASMAFDLSERHPSYGNLCWEEWQDETQQTYEYHSLNKQNRDAAA